MRRINNAASMGLTSFGYALLALAAVVASSGLSRASSSTVDCGPSSYHPTFGWSCTNPANCGVLFSCNIIVYTDGRPALCPCD